MQGIHKRIPHIMKQPRSNQQPSSFLFFDTETKGEIVKDHLNTSRQSLWFGWTIAFRYEKQKRTRESRKRFSTTSEFFDIVKSRLDKVRPLYVFAHNLGFDLTIVDFWKWSERNNIVIEYFVLSDPPTFIFCRYQGMQIVFVDTLNYWRTSLALLGESIGRDKLAMPKSKEDKKAWDIYCLGDVEILADAITSLLDYLKDNNLGSFGLSSPSMAFSTYKYRFMKQSIYIHDNLNICKLERECYYGGLVQCFYIGKITKQKIYKLDVNSLYPYVMALKYPYKYLYHIKNCSHSKARELINVYGACANVEIDDKHRTYPKRYNERFCYVKGKYETFLCGDELKNALIYRSVKRIIDISFYELAPIFQEYINFFWHERIKFKKEKNEVKQLFAKLMMNSLYGKFGQRGFDFVDLTPDSLALLYKHEGKELPTKYNNPELLVAPLNQEETWYPEGLNQSPTVRQFRNKVMIKVPSGEHSESFPAISAFVTSYARSYLFKLIDIAGKRNTYYCDTDSLFVNEQGFQNLNQKGYINPNNIGSLKIEGESLTTLIFSPKDYIFDGKETLKGIRKDAIDLGNGEFMQNQFEGLRTVFKRGYDPYIDIKWITKRNTRVYNKGIVNSSGWVEPFTLPQDFERFQTFEI